MARTLDEIDVAVASVDVGSGKRWETSTAGGKEVNAVATFLQHCGVEDVSNDA